MHSQNNETKIIQSAQQGDLEAFNHLIVQYQDLIFRIAMRMMMDENLAGDAVQDACLLAFNKLAAFRNGSFRNWLARIVVNVCYDEIRRQRRHPLQPLEPISQNDEELTSPYWLADYSNNPEKQFEASELQAAIQSCLESISPSHRAVIILIDMEYEEASDILEVPIGTIKSRLARARTQMMGALQIMSDVLPIRYCVKMPAF
jgi:RNA polymerase sigma-70 factor, ECF subfamily